MKKLLTLIAMVVLVALAAPAARGEAFSDKSGSMKELPNADALKAPLLKTAIENIESNKTTFKKRMEENFRTVQYGKAVSVLSNGSVSTKGIVHPRTITFSATKPSARRAGNRAEVVDDYGVITSPAEGESKMYNRAGYRYYVNNQQLYYAEQSGVTEIVDADSVVYIKDFISSVNVGNWVKGIKSGNTITIPAKHVIHYWADYGYGLYIARCTYVEDTGWTEVEGDITLTIDGNAIYLDNTDADNPIAAFWTDDLSFSGYADYETVFSYDPEYVAPQLVELPEGAEVQEWYAVGEGTQDVPRNIKVAFVDNDVYIANLSSYYPDSWIKGTIEGNTVTFPSLQYLGDFSSYNIWAMGFDYSSNVLSEFTMTYNAEAGTLVLDDNQLLAINADENRLYYLSYYWELVLAKETTYITLFDSLNNTINEAQELLNNAFLTSEGQNILYEAINAAYNVLYSGDINILNEKYENLKNVMARVLETEIVTVSSWTLAGSAEFFGTEWDPTNSSNDMSEVDDGVFVLTKQNVKLEEGKSYWFKVVANHSWEINFGQGGERNGNNVEVYVDQSGTYDITFYFYPNSGYKLDYTYEYISGGSEPGNLEMVYNIDYSQYRGFPFYVMGYVPEWIDGVMTDYGAMYKYVEVKDDAEETSDYIVTTQSGVRYYRIPLEEAGWHQYFIADGIPTEIGDNYIVRAKVRVSESCTVNVNMGWGGGDGQQLGASVFIPGGEWTEVEWAYDGIGGSSCNLVAQPGSFTGTIEWQWVTVSHIKKPDPRVWTEYLTNGDAEKSWEDLGLANVRYDDMENNYKVCAWGREKGINWNDNNWVPFPATIEEVDGNNVFVVHAQPTDPESGASWDNQFWIQSPRAWKAGAQIKVHFRYKASQPAKVSTQIHKQAPMDYLIWHAIGNINFTTEWQEFDGIMTMDSEMAGGWSIAFNLNEEVKDAADFYFDDLSWQGVEDEAENIVWTIAGSGEIFGTTWDPTNTNNDMSEIEDGIFVLKKEGVSLKSSALYEFKVVGNHSWDINYGADGEPNGPNVEFTVDRDGIYNLQFFFERNAGNKLYCSYEYISGGSEPGNLEMVYNIDYSNYYGFPFYVMGYVPEWNNGIMTDYGATYRYLTDSEMENYEFQDGDKEVGTVTTNNGTVYHKIQSLTGAWHQYFIADGIPTELDGHYVIRAKMRASEECFINVNMGWGWAEGQQASASVLVGTDWQEVEWEYTGINGTSCNLVAQPGGCEAVIEWSSLAVYKYREGEYHPVEWIEYLTNGDAEKSWKDMGLDNVRFDDMDSNYKICAWSKEKGRNMNENDGWDPFPTSIEVDPDNSDNHVFVVHAQPATTEGDASAWDNQFWIESPQAWKAGTQVKIHFRYKASQPARTSTQIHKQRPSDYLIWHAVGDINFTTEWQEFDGIMSIEEDMAGGWSIAFNLNPEVKDATDFYFDDLSWQAMKLEEGYFVAGCNIANGIGYDFYNATEFTWADDMGCYVATIGTRGNKDSYVDQIMISTVRGDDQAFKSNTLKPSGVVENDPDCWLEYTASTNAKVNLPGAGVWKIYLDAEYQAMAFEMIEGENKPQIEINPNPTLVIAHAQERDWLPADDDGNPREEGIGDGAAWDNQFWILANRTLNAGEETVVSFKFKATREARTTTQSHAEPGAYLHWAAIGDVYFDQGWQEFETVFTIPQQADGMRSIAFNLSEIKDANDYYFKDVVWKLSDNTESLINQEGSENFFSKAGGGDIIQCQPETEVIDVPTALAIISNLGVGEITPDYYTVKGIVTEIKEISTTYGNATFYIQSPEVSDETLYVYRAYGFNGEKITDANLFAVGDEVVIYSQLQNYKGIPETRQGGYLLSITHHVTPATLLAQLAAQIAVTDSIIANIVYTNIPGLTELNALVAEAKTATEETEMNELRNYITQLALKTTQVANLDQNYQSLADLMNRIELAIQNNPNADPELAVEASNKILEARTGLNNGSYDESSIWDMMDLMNYYYVELSKVYLTINVEEPGTLRALIEEKGFDLSSIIGLTVSGTLNDDDQLTLNQLYNIEQLDMAETNITEIWSWLFCGRPLKTVVLPKNLLRINNYAFAWCNYLTAIELPASLQYLEYNIFEGCYYLKSITYNSIIPLELYDQLMDQYYASQCTLYVPSIVTSVYQSSSYWNWFQIVGTDMIPENIIVNRAISVDWPEGIGTTFKPNVAITNSLYNTEQFGSLIINGNSTISMNNFNILWDARRSEWYSTYNEQTGSYEPYRFAYASLIANAPMRADHVSVSLNTGTYRWNFLTFPFDVKVSDIINLNQTNAPLVIRRYDGKNRADGKMGESLPLSQRPPAAQPASFQPKAKSTSCKTET